VQTINEDCETSYHKETPEVVVDILERCRLNRTRIRVHYGDTETGEDWGEVNDVLGYVGRSCGPRMIPILVHNTRSLGGARILDHRIVKITTSKGKRLLFQHPNYHRKDDGDAKSNSD